MLNRVENRTSSVEEALRDIQEGRMIIVTDDAERENEGDLYVAAEKASAEVINFMVKEGRGLICAPLTEERLTELDLPLMVTQNTDPHQTAFTVSVDARGSTTTGISVFDRVETIRTLVDEKSSPQSLRRPGHIFPLRACRGGVLERAGHTEAAVDLARMAGFKPAGVICEILNEDGSMARMPQLREFAKRHSLRILTIRDLIEYRRRTERLVERTMEEIFPTEYGDFRLYGYETCLGGAAHLALVHGEIGDGRDVLVRVHVESIPSDLFGGPRARSQIILHEAMERIVREGRGIVIYLRPEQQRETLMDQVRACLEEIHSTGQEKEGESRGILREYGIGAQILVDLGVKSLRILTNSPRRLVAVQGYGLEVLGAVPLPEGAKEQKVTQLGVRKKN